MPKKKFQNRKTKDIDILLNAIKMKRNIIIILFSLLPLLMTAQALTLDSCKIMAIQNNKHLKEARMNLEASGQVKKNAFTNYFPKVDAGAVAMRSNKDLLEASIPEMNLPVYDGNPANIGLATEFAYFPGMDISMLDYTNAAFIMAIQPLYVGGKIRNGNKLAALGEELSQYALNLTEDEILVKTESIYWNLVSLQEKRKTLNSYQKTLESLLEDVNVSYEAGLIQKSDQLKVKYELSKLESNKLKLENGIAMVKMMLCHHLGLPLDQDIQPYEDSLQVIIPQVVFTDASVALTNRNEYQMLKMAIEAERLQKQIAIGENLPQLAVGVQGLYLDVLDKQNSYGIAFATLSVPLSGWWGGSHKIKEHQIKMNIAQNNRDEKSEMMIVQINKNYRDVTEGFEQIRVATSSLEEAQEYLNVVQDNYDAGLVNTSDLLEAQTMKQQSADKLIDAKTHYKTKLAIYLQSVGQRIM